MTLPRHLHPDRLWNTFSRNTVPKAKLYGQLLTCVVIISKVSETSKSNLNCK